MTNQQAPSTLRINDEYVLSDKGIEKAPSATDWKQMYEDERKIVSDIWDALGIKTYQDAKGKSIVELVRELKAPSADTCTEDKHIKGCKCEAPSATASDKEIYELAIIKYGALSYNEMIDVVRGYRLAEEQRRPAPSATVKSKFTINDDYEVIDEDGINRTQYARSHKELRESLAKLSDVIDKSQQAPSATVDEINLELYKSKLASHSQRPTVEVDAKNTVAFRDGLFLNIELSLSRFTMYQNLDQQHQDMIRSAISEGLDDDMISKALRGSYSRADLADFANMISLEEDGSKYEGNTMNRLLDKYDTERGKSNGKV